MQTLRKKTSPLKYKNETTRFLGDGVCFKAKLIGILEVSEARGDRMCQEALSDLKMAIRAAGEHKQRITIHIALDGLRLRDEKTGDSLYHHPVHKISFIAQDMSDSRAFGYIFGSPDTGHRFFGIKTDKAASQVVIAMRDLFQVVFALKKKEIELAKIHLEKTRFPPSPLFSEGVGGSTASSKLQSLSQEKNANDSKAGAVGDVKSSTGTAVADLVDLELELNSLQQGLNQMERITPSDPFGSKDDPFGDSFISYPKPFLPPPPPSGRERSSRTSESGSLFSPKTPHTATSVDSKKKDFSFSSHDFNNSSHEEYSSGDWFTPSAGNSLFEEPAPTTTLVQREPTKDEKHEMAKQEILSQFHQPDVFTELDPLELKNPPKKVLNDLVSTNNNSQDVPQSTNLFPANFNQVKNNNPPGVFSSDPFGEDPFVKEDPFAEADFSFESEFPPKTPDYFNRVVGGNLLNLEKQMSIVKNTLEEGKLRQLHEENASLDNMNIMSQSESECAPPEPPPRPASSSLLQIKPPPLPPKKQNDLALKPPPPRPPHSSEESSHYDYMDNYETAPNSIEFIKSSEKSAPPAPPLPVPARKAKFESDFVPERPKKHFSVQSSEEDYLTPVDQPGKKTENLSKGDGLEITLSQLTLSGLNELANQLNIPASQLSNMTLAQLTTYISNFIQNASTPPSKDPNDFQADFSSNFTCSESESYDRYAVFRELIQEEIKQTKIDTEPEQIREEKPELDTATAATTKPMDKYAALREIVEIELKQIGQEEEEEEEELEEDLVDKENKLNSVEEEEKADVLGLIEYSEVKPKPKSPVVADVVQQANSNIRLNSGSLSDVVSGSSPEEVDNTANSDSGKKVEATTDAAEASKEKQAIQSEEGVSPWSSDSKEFGGNGGSPPEWRHRRKDSGSGGDHWTKRRRDQEGWWDTSAEPPTQYYPGNRRSTDSCYEEEYYECYDRPRRRRQGNWTATSGQTPGGHSSSSRDVSPWEEEPSRRPGWSRPSRQHSFDRHKERRPTDSWDEDDDDYEYDDEHGRFHWRHNSSSRESDRERHSSGGSREHEPDRWIVGERHRRRRGGGGGDITSRERWCCPDWDQVELDGHGLRYSSGRWSNPEQSIKWRDRKHDPRYYSRESQESPWEDEYSNGGGPDEEEEEEKSAYYLSAAKQRNWKQRPSSASEMDRKTGEIKSRHFMMNTGGSDGERDRRYKSARRSRSRDSSQYSEPSHRHKPSVDPTPPPLSRPTHRTKHPKPPPADIIEPPKKPEVKLDLSNKKSSTLRKKSKPAEEAALPTQHVNTFPRKCNRKSQFENDFLEQQQQRRFEGFEAEERPTRAAASKLSPRYHLNQTKSKSMFEDDFSPSSEQLPEDTSISSIKEETDVNDGEEEEEDDSFSATVTTNSTRRKKILSKNNRTATDINLKKSESVNIFARESDPFDDDFFCGNVQHKVSSPPPRSTELRWTDDFEGFDIDRKK